MHQTFQSLPLVPPAFRLIFYGMAGLATLIFLIGTTQRIALWRLGKPRPDRLLGGESLGNLLWLSLLKAFSPDCLLARKSFARSRYRGVMLVCLVWGGMGLLLGVALSAIGYIWPDLYASLGIRGALAFAMDLAGGLLTFGLLMALGRRYLFRPERWSDAPGDALVVLLLLLVATLGFAMEGVRLAGAGPEAYRTWPIGAAIGSAIWASVGGEAALLSPLYTALYLLHAGAAFGLLAYIPNSRLFHVFAAQITTFASKQDLARLDRNLRRTGELSAHLPTHSSSLGAGEPG